MRQCTYVGLSNIGRINKEQFSCIHYTMITVGRRLTFSSNGMIVRELGQVGHEKEIVEQF